MEEGKLDLHKQIIDQRVQKIIKDNAEWFNNELDEERKISKAFVLLGVASYLKMDISEAIEVITEGTNDAGVDALHISDVDNYEFTVTIFQAKYRRNLTTDAHFPENALVRVIGSIRAIFNPSSELIVNDVLKPKIAEIRSLMAEGYVPFIKCICLNNGLAWNTQGQQQIENARFDSEQVAFEHYNHDLIVKDLRSTKVIHDTLHFTGKGIVENFNYKRVLLGKMNVREIASLMDRHGKNLLEKNVRRYLGLKKNRINESIKETLLGSKQGDFYFFNNGITMVCDKFNHNALAEKDWIVNVEDLQIINGGQTCSTIQETIKKYANKSFDDGFVLVRLYELSGDQHHELLHDITIATNSQTPVDLRDLRANEERQIDLEITVKELGYRYIRKREETNNSIEAIPATVAAEAIYAIWKRKPHIMKFRKNELFGRFYDEVFSDINGAQLVLAVILYRYCDRLRKQPQLVKQYPHLPYSTHFLAMLMGETLLKQTNISFVEVTHRSFAEVKRFFEQHKEQLFEESNLRLIDALNTLYPSGYEKIELRRLSATFRREDLLSELGEKTK